MRTGNRLSTVILLAVSGHDAVAEMARYPGLRTARIHSPGALDSLRGLRATAVYATAAAREHRSFADALQMARICVVASGGLLPERVA